MIPRLAHSPATKRLYADFIRELRRRGFEGDYSSGYGDRLTLSTDNSIYQRLPEAVLHPRGVGDVVHIASLAAEERFRELKLAPRGGGTGTNGQSLTEGMSVDLSRHMNGIIEIDPENRWVRVQAGVVKDQLNRALRRYGLFFAPEISTSNRATIGGMISTDASGQGSCLYGKTRDHVPELLGAFSTIAQHRPVNLSILVLDNEQYAETGMQKTATGFGTSLAAVARACGLSNAEVLTRQEEAASLRPKLHAMAGMLVAVLKIKPGDQPRTVPEREGTLIASHFMRSLLRAVNLRSDGLRRFCDDDSPTVLLYLLLICERT